MIEIKCTKEGCSGIRFVKRKTTLTVMLCDPCKTQRHKDINYPKAKQWIKDNWDHHQDSQKKWRGSNENYQKEYKKRPDVIERYNTPEHQARLEANKNTTEAVAKRNSPEYKAKRKAQSQTPQAVINRRARRQDPERKRKMKDKRKEKKQDPEYQEKQRLKRNTPEAIDKRRARQTDQKHKNEAKLRRSTPEAKQKRANRYIKKKQDPEYQEKQRLKRNTPEAIWRRKELSEIKKNDPACQAKRQDPEYQEKQRLKRNTPGAISKRKENNNIKKNDPVRRAKSKERHRIRMLDPVCRLKNNMRSSIGNAFRSKGYKKSSRTHEILGCSYEEFYAHLEMTCVQNYGISMEELKCVDYHVDHIAPMAIAATEEDVINFNHFSNLQILTADDNGEKNASLTWKCAGYD